ncbi:MAG: trehalose-phosphatase [Alphaproteobacteria bacterium]|nr:trehalose-phosphatase [Alphaproteobacteria bacterium]MBV9692506.1 trehalose-phosphatase [Alphaproteobacteria bacterium]
MTAPPSTLDLSRTALFLDIDGTMLDIAPTPAEVLVPAGLGETLSGLSRRCGGALAVISGRTIEDIDRLFAPNRFPAAGIHGAQLRAAPNGGIDHLSRPMPESLRAHFASVASAHPGAFVEDKGVTLALHYRLSEHPVLDHEHVALLEREAEAAGFTILHGKKVLELKPKGVSKGAAIRAFMQHPPFASRIPVFAGDDWTDAHGFAVLAGLKGFGIAVGARFEDAQYCIPRPEDFRLWLESLLSNAASAPEPALRPRVSSG